MHAPDGVRRAGSPAVSAGGPVAPFTLVTCDGYPVAATRFKAQGEARAVALIAPATGAPQRFYGPFARHLAAAGFDVITWDWRGIGESRHERAIDGMRLSMTAWGTCDLEAALQWAVARAAGRQVVYVGHSFGGQALGLARSAGQVSRAVFVGAQDGWLGHWPASHRVALAMLWWLAMPAASHLLGRFPSSTLGFGEDLPRSVALEWARWCRNRDYHGQWSGHAALELPLLSLSFADDWIAPLCAVQALNRRHARARIAHRHVVPGTSSIGHFGFFRDGRTAALWDEARRFLLG